MIYKYEMMHYVRKNKHISLDCLAKKVGVSKSYLSLIEIGKRKLSYDLATKIAISLEMSPDELFFKDHLDFLNSKENE